MFQIERDIPMPPRAVRKSGNVFPLASMNVGDSFLVPLGDNKIERIRARIQNHVSHFRKDNAAKKFSMRAVEGGIRVWRTE